MKAAFNEWFDNGVANVKVNIIDAGILSDDYVFAVHVADALDEDNKHMETIE